MGAASPTIKAMPHTKVEIPAVHWEAVESLRARPHPDAGDLFTHLGAIFEQETPIIVDAIGRAWRENQAGELEDYAHTLKGNSVVVGAQRLHVLCAEIVDACCDGLVPNPETIQGLSLAYAAWLDSVGR